MCEALFQLPFFFVAVYALVFRKSWIRAPLIAYGAHVSTTVIPILTEFMESAELDLNQKLTLFGFYGPFLIVPLTLMIHMCVNDNLFGRNDTEVNSSKKTR